MRKVVINADPELRSWIAWAQLTMYTAGATCVVSKRMALGWLVHDRPPVIPFCEKACKPRGRRTQRVTSMGTTIANSTNRFRTTLDTLIRKEFEALVDTIRFAVMHPCEIPPVQAHERYDEAMQIVKREFPETDISELEPANG